MCGWYYLSFLLFYLVCDNSTYGNNCVHNCSRNCLNYSPCNKETGHCKAGCNPGYTNVLCNQGNLIFLKNVTHSILLCMYKCLWNTYFLLSKSVCLRIHKVIQCVTCETCVVFLSPGIVLFAHVLQ